MEHTLFMSGGEASAQLAGNFESLRRTGRRFLDPAGQDAQVFAVDIFHRKIKLAVDLAQIVNAADVGMRHLARDADFVAEAIKRLRVVRGFDR